MNISHLINLWNQHYGKPHIHMDTEIVGHDFKIKLIYDSDEILDISIHIAPLENNQFLFSNPHFYVDSEIQPSVEKFQSLHDKVMSFSVPKMETKNLSDIFGNTQIHRFYQLVHNKTQYYMTCCKTNLYQTSPSKDQTKKHLKALQIAYREALRKLPYYIGLERYLVELYDKRRIDKLTQ